MLNFAFPCWNLHGNLHKQAVICMKIRKYIKIMRMPTSLSFKILWQNANLCRKIQNSVSKSLYLSRDLHENPQILAEICTHFRIHISKSELFNYLCRGFWSWFRIWSKTICPKQGFDFRTCSKRIFSFGYFLLKFGYFSFKLSGNTASCSWFYKQWLHCKNGSL